MASFNWFYCMFYCYNCNLKKPSRRDCHFTFYFNQPTSSLACVFCSSLKRSFMYGSTSFNVYQEKHKLIRIFYMAVDRLNTTNNWLKVVKHTDRYTWDIHCRLFIINTWYAKLKNENWASMCSRTFWRIITCKYKTNQIN